MKSSAREIATVGVLAALQIIVLVAGYYLDVVSISCNVIASLILSLTLVRGMYKHTLLAYVAVSIVTLLVMNVHALPYVLFTGGYTIFTCFCREKRWRLLPSWAIKIAWANLAFYLLYSVFSVVVINFAELGFTVPYIWLAVIVTLAVIGYDLVLHRVLFLARDISDRIFRAHTE